MQLRIPFIWIAANIACIAFFRLVGLMMSSPKTLFWRYHLLFVVAVCAILIAVADCAAVILMANIRTVGQARTALASDWIHIRATDLSGWQKCALITVQDPGFYENPGVRHAFRVAFTNTTIQQIVLRKLHFPDYKPGITSMIQMMAACDALERFISKDDQLTLFINSASFGRDLEGKPINGFAVAANAYFNKSFTQLSGKEYLSLVVMLIDPTHLDSRTHPKENAERQASFKDILIGRCSASTEMSGQ